MMCYCRVNTRGTLTLEKALSTATQIEVATQRLRLGCGAVVHLPVGTSLHPQNKSSSTHDTADYEGRRWRRPTCRKGVCPSHVLQLRHCLAPRDVSLTSCLLPSQLTILLLLLQLTMIWSMLHYSPLSMRVLMQLIRTLPLPHLRSS